ncbi:translation initiation factor IF-2-like [Trachypithecus francoisi]|uniref:translation initiation factor IF-2-like n=1 Tax=Trachypithecus francoisi TaxID=54180 RepID=UPI00141B2465|nr:translation initiation factor IF-2-like [Trachypithecus francoisi]
MAALVYMLRGVLLKSDGLSKGKSHRKETCPSAAKACWLRIPGVGAGEEARPEREAAGRVRGPSSQSRGRGPVRKNGGERGGVDRQKALSEQGEPAGWVAPSPPPEPPRGSWRTIKMGIHLCCGGPRGADSGAAPEPARGEGVVRARGARVRRPPASRVCFLPLTPQPRGFPPRPAGPGRQRWYLHAPPGPAAGRAQEHAVARQEEPGTGTQSGRALPFASRATAQAPSATSCSPRPHQWFGPPRHPGGRDSDGTEAVPCCSGCPRPACRVLPQLPPPSRSQPGSRRAPRSLPPRTVLLPSDSSTAPGTEGNRHRPLLFPFPLHR